MRRRQSVSAPSGEAMTSQRLVPRRSDHFLSSEKIMKRTLCLAVGLLAGPLSHAQSTVTLYGLIDAGLMYTNNVAKGGSTGPLFQATSGNINGSRFGLRGAEDLGGGLQAIFVLENGFNLQNGKLGQDNRLFGRQAFVGLGSTDFGTVTLGRQYDFMVDFVAPLSGVASTFGDTGFAHPYDNDNLDHSVRLNNSIKYTSVDYAGFKFGGLYAFSNSSDFSVNRAYSVGASYARGPLSVAAGYLQMNGTNSTTNTAGAIDVAESAANGTGGFQLGSNVQRTVGAAVDYAFGPAILGFVFTHSQFQGTTSFGSANGSVRFDNFELNGKYALSSMLSLGASYTYSDGHVTSSTTNGSDPKWNQANLQAVYKLSKRTDFYAEAMYQHVSGANYVAYVNNSGGASTTSNQVVGILGIRSRF
jgi:GBP family porin